MSNDKLDEEIVGYIFKHYRYLMTKEEIQADRSFLFLEKANNMSSEKMKERAIELANIKNNLFLGMGIKQFRQHVSRRVLQEQANQVFFNFCPKCGNLTASPQAKLCLKCGFSWFEKGDSQ